MTAYRAADAQTVATTEAPPIASDFTVPQALVRGQTVSVSLSQFVQGSPITSITATVPASDATFNFNAATQVLAVTATLGGTTQSATYTYTVTNAAGSSTAHVTVSYITLSNNTPNTTVNSILPNQDPGVVSTIQSIQQSVATSTQLQTSNLNRRLDDLRSSRNTKANRGISVSGLTVSTGGLSLSPGTFGSKTGVAAMLMGAQDRSELDRRIWAQPWRAYELEQNPLVGGEPMGDGFGLDANRIEIARKCSQQNITHDPGRYNAEERMVRDACQQLGLSANEGADGSIELPDQVGIFVNGQVAFGNQGSGSGSSGYRLNTVGITFGGDYRFDPAFTLGVGGGYSNNNTSINGGGKSDSNGFSVNTYGLYQLTEQIYLEGFVSYGNLAFDNQRLIQNQVIFAQGNTNSHTLQSSLTGGYEVPVDAWTLNPYTRLNGSRTEIDAFTENSAGTNNLVYNGRTIDSLSATLGFKLDYSLSTEFGVLLPYGRLEYEHEFAGSSNASVQFADLLGTSSPTQVGGGSAARSIGRIGVGASAVLPNSLSLFADYEAQITNTSQTINTFTIGLQKRF